MCVLYIEELDIVISLSVAYVHCCHNAVKA